MTKEPTQWNRLLITDEILDSEVAAAIKAIHQEAVEFVKSWAREMAIKPQTDTSHSNYGIKAISVPANYKDSSPSNFVGPDGDHRFKLLC